MFDKITYHQSPEVSNVPYCKEVNYNLPTTKDDIQKIREWKTQIRDDLLSMHIAEIKALNCQALVSRWKSETRFGTEMLIQIRQGGQTYDLRYLTQYEVNTQEFLNQVEEKVRELVFNIVRVPCLYSLERLK